LREFVVSFVTNGRDALKQQYIDISYFRDILIIYMVWFSIGQAAIKNRTNLLSRNVGLQSLSDTEQHPIRKETSNAPLRKPSKF
jgi:predicted kinase